MKRRETLLQPRAQPDREGSGDTNFSVEENRAQQVPKADRELTGDGDREDTRSLQVVLGAQSHPWRRVAGQKLTAAD